MILEEIREVCPLSFSLLFWWWCWRNMRAASPRVLQGHLWNICPRRPPSRFWTPCFGYLICLTRSCELLRNTTHTKTPQRAEKPKDFFFWQLWQDAAGSPVQGTFEKYFNTCSEREAMSLWTTYMKRPLSRLHTPQDLDYIPLHINVLQHQYITPFMQEPSERLFFVRNI